MKRLTVEEGRKLVQYVQRKKAEGMKVPDAVQEYGDGSIPRHIYQYWQFRLKDEPKTEPKARKPYKKRAVVHEVPIPEETVGTLFMFAGSEDQLIRIMRRIESK